MVFRWFVVDYDFSIGQSFWFSVYRCSSRPPDFMVVIYYFVLTVRTGKENDSSGVDTFTVKCGHVCSCFPFEDLNNVMTLLRDKDIGTVTGNKDR